MDWAGTVAELVRRRADDPRPGLVAGDRSWSWSQVVAEAAARAGWYAEDRGRRGASGPPHVGVLLDNTPDYALWLTAAALGRFVVVGLNATRRADGLTEDVRATACDLVVTDAAGAALLDVADLGPARVVDTAAASYPPCGLPVDDAEPGDLHVLVFTSGTTGSPKAVRCSQGKIAWSAQGLVMRTELTADDVVYCAMPLFHSNAVIAGWGPALAVGATLALPPPERPRFSASGFLPDVRRYAATYANYVGTPLSYVLAQPAHEDDADNPLRLVFGNEGAPADLGRFAERFGCRVVDGFGSSEGGISISRTPETPAGALGLPNGDVRVLDPATGKACPEALLDEAGRLTNPEAVGELVNCDGAGMFEGYWDAPADDAHRLRDGRYWSGDLGYRTADGFLWFAGRSGDRLRVGGENFPAAPVARLLGQHPSVVEVVVYAVPDPTAGDQVMAAVVPGDGFDPAGFASWAAAQPGCAAPWVPRFLRVLSEVPRTPTGKVLTRVLAQQRWDGEGVWLRDGRALELRPMSDADRAVLATAFTDAGRPLL
ncbi:MAG: AMP-binding protein [Mycobacteriales bacterium]|nr:AMP-binding protein [Mycobacteriales bacterium]